VQLKQGGSPVGSPVITGADGAFTFFNVPEGSGYTIEVSLDGYTSETPSLFAVTDSMNFTLTLTKITGPVYTVSGVIRTDYPGGGANGATVQLQQGGVNVGNPVYTGADGAFTISNVPAGTGYTIEVFLEGYTTGTIPSFNITTDNVTGKDLTLAWRGYTISGTITTDSPGGPASGASVQLKQNGADVGSPVITGADGTYTISNVLPGTNYMIEVFLDGYYPMGGSLADVTTANVTDRNLTLIRTRYTVSGTISTDNPGGAASGASVQLKQGGNTVGSAVNTGTDGTYTIPDVLPGNGYTIEVSLSGYTPGTIPSFDVTTYVTDKNLTLARTRYTVSGTISTDNPGGAASGASVQLKRAGNAVGSPVSTGTNGTYTILDILPGNAYTIEVSLTGYNTGTSSSFNVTENVTGKDLTLTKITVPVYTVSGTISTNNPGGGANGASVQLKQGGSNVGGAVSTEANGTYTIPDIPAGTGYTIEVSLTGYTTGTISSFDVMGDVTNKDLTLARIVYTVSGTISTDNPGGGANGAAVQVKQGGTNVGYAITTWPDGTYTIGVPVGEGYTIEVSLAGYHTGTSSSFNVTANVTGKDLTLTRIFYTVSGTISTDDPGGGANEVTVQLQQDGANVGSPVSTGTNGTYTIPDVLPGSGYTIEVSLEGYTTGTISSFNVTTANITGKDLTLTKITVPVYTVSGTISTDNPGGAASGASVQLKQGGGNVGSPVSTGANGTYTIPNVLPGTGYTIEVSLAEYTTGTISTFDVTAANVTDKNLTLAMIR
jgi:3-hydroxymyristoyl/3-hydroxydecanoyl-(acyl carrier protein) dehydratase